MKMTVAIGALILFGLLLAGSRSFYRHHLRTYARGKLAQLGSSPEAVTCSLDRMVYLVPLPTYEDALRHACETDIAVELDLRGWMFPELVGVRIVLLGLASPPRQIAYLAASQFTSPALDRFCVEGTLDRYSYLLLSQSLLVQPSTLAEIRATAFKRLQSGPFNLT